MTHSIDNLIMRKKINSYQTSHKMIKIFLKYKYSRKHLIKILKIKMYEKRRDLKQIVDIHGNKNYKWNKKNKNKNTLLTKLIFKSDKVSKNSLEIFLRMRI